MIFLSLAAQQWPFLLQESCLELRNTALRTLSAEDRGMLEEEYQQLKEAIDYIDGRAEIEVSGNVTKENIERIKGLGVDYVSSGALTHSAPIMDISLKNLHAV